MINDDLKQAIELILNRQPKNALPILLSIIESNPKNELAWFWLAACTYEKDLRIKCLQKVLELNPNNQLAKDVLAKTLEELKSENTEKKHNDISKSPKTSYKKKYLTQEKSKQVSKKLYKNRSGMAAEEPKEKRTVPKNKKEAGDLHNKEGFTEGITVSKFLLKKISEVENNFLGMQQEGIDLLSRYESGIYGNTIFVDGVRFSTFEGPPCIRLGQELVDVLCESCEYFSPINCLLKYDEFLVEDIKRQRRIELEHQAKIVHRGRIVTKIIFDELKGHGRPLHYSVITKIIVARYPKLLLNERKISRYLLWHPELFESMGDGVYRAK